MTTEEEIVIFAKGFNNVTEKILDKLILLEDTIYKLQVEIDSLKEENKSIKEALAKSGKRSFRTSLY